MSHKPSTASQVALVVNNLPANARDERDAGTIPEQGRSPDGGQGDLLQYSCPENPHGQRSLAGYTVHGVAKSQTFFATEAIKHANLQFYSVSFLKNTHKKPRNKQRREFPVVQWLGLCAFTAEERPEFNAWSGNQDPASHGAQPKKPDQNKTKKKTNQAKHTGFSLRTFRHTFGMPAAYMASTVKLFFLKIPICYMIFKRLYFLDDGK